MAAKRVDPLKAKAAKQKKMAIGLCLMLVLVVAYQGPKTLKLLKGPQPVAAAAEAPTTPASGTEATPPGVPAPTTSPDASAPTTPATTPSAGAPADAVAQPAVLANTDLPVTAGEGQLLSFEQFASKDPFKQQATVTADPDTDVETTTDPEKAITPDDDPKGPVGSAENPPLSTGGIGGSGSSGSPTGAAAAAPATATTISVNGAVETIVDGKPFPADQPTFEVVSIAKDGKSMQIGVAGGTISGGGATVKLTIGKVLTLQNTSDGSLYKLKLLTVAGFVPPTSKG
jgi:hypothetical protein